MLKLYTGCPLMVTENIEVRAGIANGTQASFEGVMLKFGKTSSKTAVDGIEIDSAILRIACGRLRPGPVALCVW